jgi:hypothetical protein
MIPEGKGWLYASTKKGVEIYIMTKEFSTKNPKVLIQHIGFSKDSHWFNYCLPVGTEWYLDEFLEFFIADCAIKDNWKEMLKKVHENDNS